MTDERMVEALGKVFAQVFGIDAGTDMRSVSVETHSAWDSMSHISLVLAVEQEFRVAFTPEEAYSALSFEAMLDLLESRRSPQ